MKFLWATLLVVLVCSSFVKPVRADAGGGIPCAACTMVVQIVFNLMVVDNSTFDHALVNYCTTLPEPYTTPCIVFADTFGEQLLAYVGDNASSDQICQGLGVCTNSSCNLFPERTGILPLAPIAIPKNYDLKVGTRVTTHRKKIRTPSISNS
jgi:hypothetical protein